MKKIAFFVFALTLCLALASCSQQKGGDEADRILAESAALEEEAEAAEPVSIIGSWDCRGYVYTFKEDNTGTYNLPGNTVMKLTYEATADTLSILFDGNTTPNVCVYTIQDGTLTVKDSFGNDVKYVKK